MYISLTPSFFNLLTDTLVFWTNLQLKNGTIEITGICSVIGDSQSQLHVLTLFCGRRVSKLVIETLLL